MDQVRIGLFMKEMRTEKGLTQAALAEQLSVSDKTISKWENGKSLPDPALMLPMCEALAISVNELLSGQRILPNEYHSKAEETMMNLVKEKENGRKEQVGSLVWGLILFIALITFTKLLMPQADWIGIFINVIDLLVIFLIDGILLFACGYQKDFLHAFRIHSLENKEIQRSIDALELIRKTTIFSSLFISILSILAIIRLADDLLAAGPNFSNAILGLFYAFIINLVLFIPIYRLKSQLEK